MTLQEVLTIFRMQVKTLPLRRQVTPYLGHTEQAATCRVKLASGRNQLTTSR
ncbi:MAG: hypothetical protein F6K26_40915 [Moorea sp. SIO2I5]|nr:hypothetical protein [Moorena sp. SIO2I5]